MEKEFILESKVNELEEEVHRLKCENARLKCHLLALASENHIELSFDVRTYLNGAPTSLKMNESDKDSENN